MDVPGGPDRVWRSIKELANSYARLPALPPQEQMEHDVQRIIHENLGRDIDRRLIAFYIRELQQLATDARSERHTRGEVEPEGNGAAQRR